MSARPRPDESPDAFRDAIAQWQLAARTEVKRSSSLPSSMFDTCDPMLEARLADSLEDMLQHLSEPEGLRAARERAADAEGDEDKRIEQVSPDELRRLPSHVTGEAPPLDVDDGLSAEYLGLLVDACTTGDLACRAAARELLARDFGVDAERGLEAATDALLACLPDLLGAPGDGAAAAARLTELCNSIAAIVVAREDGDA